MLATCGIIAIADTFFSHFLSITIANNQFGGDFGYRIVIRMSKSKFDLQRREKRHSIFSASLSSVFDGVP